MSHDPEVPLQTSRQTARKWVSELVEIAVVVGAVFISTTALAQPFYVPSGSMEPTLQIGDAFLGSKFPYGWSRYSMPFAMGPHSDTRLMGKMPRQGDVVVFRHPKDGKEVLVKRLVGMPGDTVQMIHGRLVINGKMLALTPAGTGMVEDGVGAKMSVARYTETLPDGVKHPIFKWQWDGMVDNTEPVKIPAGHFFMMGDNRDNSLDSRVAIADGGVGFVPAENLMARADIMIGSYDYLNASSVTNWLSQIRLSRFFRLI